MALHSEKSNSTQRQVAFIQAHALNWDGAVDRSLIEIDGKQAICWTIEAMSKVQGIDEIVILTTDDPEDVIYIEIAKRMGIGIYLGDTHNVLERLLKGMEAYQADIAVLCMGMHPFVNPEFTQNALDTLLNQDLDLIHPPLYFPVPFASNVFHKRALIHANDLLSQMAESGNDIRPLLARPLTFIRENRDAFKVAELTETPSYSDEELLHIRNKVRPLYADEAPEINPSKSYLSASYGVERYRFALRHVTKPSRVLDIACGSGFGTHMLYEAAGEAIGADLDLPAIQAAQAQWQDVKGLSFVHADAQDLPFEDHYFDTVVSLDTIEHVPDLHQYASEMHRVLKPDGIFICTTPQSYPPFGRIPYICWHIQEFSPQELRDSLSDFFDVTIHGVLNGIIREDGIEEGTAMIAVCHAKVLAHKQTPI